MQLTRRLGSSAVLAVVAWLSAGGAAHAQSGIDTTTSLFHERGGPLNMTVLVPSARADVELGDAATLSAGWTADVVSGASVAVVDAPASDVDAISSASVTDTRHAFSGALELRDGTVALSLGYTHAFENDYLSNAIDVGARAELFDRNTTLSISYARNFDLVCDVAGTFEPVMKPRMDSSRGCADEKRGHVQRELAMHGFQVAWSQALTPVLSAQLGVSAQLLHGFQANPYRAVRIGKTAAQEHHPLDRARYAGSAGLRLWITPLAGALSANARLYRDTWDIASVAGELAYDQSIAAGVRMRAQGRYATQTGAAFFSDDYVFAPRGQYFTGDRELSPMRSLLVGAQMIWVVPPDERGEILSFLSGLELTLKGDLLQTYFSEFHYDRAEVPNTLALLGAFELHAMF